MLFNTLLSTMTLLAVLGLAVAILMPTQGARQLRHARSIKPLGARNAWSNQSPQDWSTYRD